MEFAFSAMTGGLAALTGTLRKGSAKKPTAGNKLSDAGTQVTFGRREGGTGKDVSHFLYRYHIQDSKKKSSPKHNENMLPLQPQSKNQLKRRPIQMF